LLGKEYPENLNNTWHHYGRNLKLIKTAKNADWMEKFTHKV
jgi:hypothetical protein